MTRLDQYDPPTARDDADALACSSIEALLDAIHDSPTTIDPRTEAGAEKLKQAAYAEVDEELAACSSLTPDQLFDATMLRR